MCKQDLTTQIYLKKEDKFLMLYRNKKQNDLNAGKWIGVGGHIEDGETPLEAVKREVLEETGLKLKSAELKAKLLFVNDDYEEIIYQFISSDFDGDLIECDEGDLVWIPIDKIMSLPLWEGDKSFLPLLINNSPYFEMTLTYKNSELISVIKTL